MSSSWSTLYRRVLTKPLEHIIHDKQWTSSGRNNKNTCESLNIKISCLFEGLGPLENCRSRLSDSDKQILSSGNLMGTSLVTKQCSNPEPVFWVFPCNWCLVIWESPPEKRSCLIYHKIIFVPPSALWVSGLAWRRYSELPSICKGGAPPPHFLF